MKKLLTLLIFCPVLCLAQKSKRVEVTRCQFASVVAYINYTQDTPTDTTYIIYGTDARYTQITELITFKTGTLSDIYFFLKHCKEFLSAEQDGTSIDIAGVHISVMASMGVKGLMIFNPDKYGSGHTILNGLQLKKMMDGILSYCGDNNLRIKKQ